MAGLSDPYAIMRVGPQHFTSKHVDNTNSPKWNETYEVRGGFLPAVTSVGRWPFSFHFAFFCLIKSSRTALGMSVFCLWGHGASASVLSGPLQFSCPCVCLVHQVIVHEVPGQELEVEVYDKDPDQDDFLGRYICTWTLHASKLVSLCFICHPSRKGGIKLLFRQKLKRLLLWYKLLSQHQNQWFH